MSRVQVTVKVDLFVKDIVASSSLAGLQCSRPTNLSHLQF